MALEWSKEISFSGLMKKSTPSAKTGYPEKTYMNLAVRDARTIDLRRVLVVGLALLLAVGLFVKFGVFDFYDRVNQKQAELAQQQSVLSSLQAKLADYDSVESEFEAYGSAMLSSNADTVSALEALGLVDNMIAPQAQVLSVSLSGNTLTLRLSNITLDNLGTLVSSLYGQPMVSNVTVSTAATQETAASDVVAAMTITLQRA